jgi:hypothetical protein
VLDFGIPFTRRTGEICIIFYESVRWMLRLAKHLVLVLVSENSITGSKSVEVGSPKRLSTIRQRRPVRRCSQRPTAHVVLPVSVDSQPSILIFHWLPTMSALVWPWWRLPALARLHVLILNLSLTQRAAPFQYDLVLPIGPLDEAMVYKSRGKGGKLGSSLLRHGFAPH